MYPGSVLARKTVLNSVGAAGNLVALFLCLDLRFCIFLAFSAKLYVRCTPDSAAFFFLSFECSFWRNLRFSARVGGAGEGAGNGTGDGRGGGTGGGVGKTSLKVSPFSH